jgi:hypothetical protein
MLFFMTFRHSQHKMQLHALRIFNSKARHDKITFYHDHYQDVVVSYSFGGSMQAIYTMESRTIGKAMTCLVFVLGTVLIYFSQS